MVVVMDTRRKLTHFNQELQNGLQSKGFGKANEKRMRNRLVKAGRLEEGSPMGMFQSGESILNRGLNSKRSNFAVFIHHEPDKNRVIVYYMNPDASENAPMKVRHWKNGKKGPVKKGQNYFIRKEYRGTQNSDAMAWKIIDDILHYASLKPETEYREESHVHFGYFPEGYRSRIFYDDGMSNALDIMRIMAITNRDVLIPTSHNTPNLDQFFTLEIIGQELGIVAMPGMELTAPSQAPNGPHVCCRFSNHLAANEAKRIALKGKSNFRMPPFNDAEHLLTLIPQLYNRLASSGQLLMTIAHPMNVYKKDHKVLDVGLMSCIENGPYDFPTIESLLPFFQATEAWNATLSQKLDLPRFSDPAFNEYIHEVVSTHLPGLKATPNSFAYAFAQEMLQTGAILHSTFGTDDHYTPPMDYRCNGVAQVRGHTSIDLARVYSRMAADRKPTSEELMSWLSTSTGMHDEEGYFKKDPLTPMRGHVYSKIENSRMVVPWGRRERNPHTQKLVSKMLKDGMGKYRKAIFRDAATFKFNGHELSNLIRTYFG